MTNKTKIIIGIIIIIVIIAIIFGVVKNRKTDEIQVNKNSEYGNVFDYVNKINEEENKIKNEVENNVIEDNSIPEEKEDKNNDVIQNNVIVGKEEHESDKENPEVDKKALAIELAKKEWAISVNSYDFQAEVQSDGMYIVKVINKTNRNEVTRYTVNVETEKVVEAE